METVDLMVIGAGKILISLLAVVHLTIPLYTLEETLS